MQLCCKKIRLVCLVCAIVMILGGCSLKEKPEPTNQQEQAETTDVPSSLGTKNGNEVMFSCEGLTEKGNSKYTLLLSLSDSDSKLFLCTYQFQNVSLMNNAQIDLSNVSHGQITISANHEENTYSGFISAIR